MNELGLLKVKKSKFTQDFKQESMITAACFIGSIDCICCQLVNLKLVVQFTIVTTFKNK